LDALLKCRSTLEEVNKALEDYLESKRGAFPRYSHLLFAVAGFD